MNIYQHQCVFADNLATQHYYAIIENAIQQPRKKYRKTNQQEIMGRKYASMNDEEFNSYISKMKSLLAKNRATNLRTKWINIVEDRDRDSNESK
jgi:hypothetical protein